MREALAERLLAKVMEWTSEDVARERPVLQAMAAFKYDEYQKFSPGMRFVESLALWLNQFSTKRERDTAYNFVKERLIFFSNVEISHFVAISYPNLIRPLLIRRTAEKVGVSERFVQKVTKSMDYHLLRRRCLFLGLSDGARIDAFRRNNSDLSHEQIWQTYELTSEKALNMHEKLKRDLKVILGRTPTEEDISFRMIFLLDDFTGSGFSYLRKENEKSNFSGKISKFYHQLYQLNGV